MRDLQESLLKRHPNSVASLIRAASVPDETQAALRRQQEREVEGLRAELEGTKEQQERRLRSLRQEHERIKSQYEKVVSDLQQQLKSQQTLVPTSAAIAVPHGALGGATKSSSSSIHTVTTLSQALDRIR